MARKITGGYMSARRPGRRRITTGILVALALIVGAFAVGRLTAPTIGTSTAAPSNLPMRDGIPIPDRHTVAAAATIAADYQIAGFRVSAGTLNAADATAVLLAPNASDAAREVLAAPTQSADQLGATRTSYAPLSIVVQSYTATQAVVQVWGVAASSTHVTPQPAGTEDWSRTTVTLGWDGSQWRVIDQHFLTGPWPARDIDRMAASDGDFTFRYSELSQDGWSYVPEP